MRKNPLIFEQILSTYLRKSYGDRYREFSVYKLGLKGLIQSQLPRQNPRSGYL